MSQIAFPLRDDGLVADMDAFIKRHHGRVLRGSIGRDGTPLLHVEFADMDTVAADIMRRKVEFTYLRMAA